MNPTPLLLIVTEAKRWAKMRHEHLYRPEGLEEHGFVRCWTSEELEQGTQTTHPLRIVLFVDSGRLDAAVQAHPPCILGPVERNAVVEVAPLRRRTPDDHTLFGVLTQLQLQSGPRGPELERRLSDAFRRDEPSVCRVVASELRGFPNAEVQEIVQEVMSEAWELLPDYRPERRFRALLANIARKKCANWRRKKRDALLEDSGAIESADLDVLTCLEDQERGRILNVAARTLDPLDQEIVHLRYVLDYPLDQIAQQLVTKADAGSIRDANGVRVALQRIRRRLGSAIRRMQMESTA